MAADRKHFSLLRMLGLLAVLLIETGLTVSLWADGWLGTGSHLRMLACGAAAALPLIVATALIFRNRFRFGLRSLLAAIALVAVFMFFSVRPLLEARDARQASRWLADNGVKVFTELNRGDFFIQLGYDPHLPRSYEPPRREIPPWLKPLSGDLSNFPPDEAVVEVWLESDAQVVAFCRVAHRMPNLEDVGVSGLSADGMELLRKHLPQLPRLVAVTVNNAGDIPDGWLASLDNVRSLAIWALGKRMGSPLAIEHLQDVAELPQLKVLLIIGYAVDDDQIQALSQSNSLSHLVLKYSKVTPQGRRRLTEALPDLEIRGD